MDKEWGKLQKIEVWNTSKVKRKQDVINEAKVNNRRVHFRHVVLRGEDVKNDTVVMQSSPNKKHQRLM